MAEPAAFTRRMALPCPHLSQIRVVVAETDGCEECLKSGDTWVHLRLCLVCGHTGCCDSSKNRHATRHARDSGHPLVGSIEPGEAWRYCYADDLMM